MKSCLLIFAMLCFCFACNKQIEQKTDFLEVRITRQTALEGGETLVLRKIDKDWSAMLLGDGYRVSCLYQKSAQPKSGWENLWQELLSGGLLEIADGRRLSNLTDGNRYIVEVNYQNKLKRYQFDNPGELKTKDSEQLRNIGNLISREFETPMFIDNYERGEVGDYLMEQCRSFSGQDSIH